MAPDINSLPPSPRPRRQSASTASIRISQVMGPPSMPASSSAAATHVAAPAPPPQRPSMPRPNSEQTGMPLRHPRPLTAAELYLECEKEQEAVVNRLTRELTALRARSASVASNASQSSTSTSASLLPVDITDPNPTHQITGATHPTPSRRHRSSSSLSTRSIPTSSTSASIAASSTTNVSTQAQPGSSSSVPIGGVSQASADRAAAAGNLSRQPSISASGTSTPARQSLDMARQGHSVATLHTLPHRPSLSRDPSYVNSTAAPAASHIPHPLPSPARSPSQSVHSQHYAETAAYRTEMEIVKAENEALRQRVRVLERALRSRRRDSSHSDATRPVDLARSRESLEAARPPVTSPWAGDGGVGGVAGPRERSESQSTTASSRRAAGLDDEVRVGESASSVGIGRGV